MHLEEGKYSIQFLFVMQSHKVHSEVPYCSKQPELMNQLVFSLQLTQVLNYRGNLSNISHKAKETN